MLNNFDLVLQQYLVKFIKYADTLSANVTFIYIGSGLINYYAQATKLKSLCITKRCNFKHMTDVLSQLEQPTINTNTNMSETQMLSDMLYKFTDGGVIKSWFIMQLFMGSSNKTLATPSQLFSEYILPNMPILNSVYELLHILNKTVTAGIYSITPIMNRLYILNSYPNMNITRLINMMFNLFVFVHKHYATITHPLYLSNTELITLNQLRNEFISLDKIKPYSTNESILILRGFITKLLLFLSNQS